MNWSSASTRSRLRTGYSTKSSRLVALVMRMERISLALSHPLSPSLSLSLTLSFGWTTTPIGGFSGKSPKFDPESVPKKLAARHTEDRINHSRQEKILFLPSRDHEKLDLDAMCLDLEAFPTTKPRNSGSRQRGFHSSAPTPPTTSHFTPATALHPLPPSAEHHPKDPQLLLRRPTSQPRKKQKFQARIERMANLFSDRIFETKTHKMNGLDWTEQNRTVGQDSRHSTAGVMHNA